MSCFQAIVAAKSTISSRAKLHLCFALLVGIGAAIAIPEPTRSSSEAALSAVARTEKTDSGAEWLLEDWGSGTRPYPKDLKEREAWYRNTWGESWAGVRNSRRIHNPGNWQWEEVVKVPPAIAVELESKKPRSNGKPYVWGDRVWGTCFIWGPGGGQVTDIYAMADNGIFHYDPINKATCFIGDPVEGGLKDGIQGEARLRPGSAVTLDPVTGRLYFIQGKSWRYVDKLLPYQCVSTKKVCYLPAVLEWHEGYRLMKSPFGGGLMPVLKDGKRAEPVFAVRSNSSLKSLNLPGALRGRRPLITPDGKGAYFSQIGASGRGWDRLTLYNTTALFDIDTGKMIKKLALVGDVPQNMQHDGPGSHGGNCLGYDGKIYTCQHGGAGGGPGRMFSIDPESGTVTMLYNSVEDDKTWKKRKNPLIDGPADAWSLDFTSTLWQVQCPRTGAVINGGWDNTGIRRYHDGFVTTIVNGDEQYRVPPRPGWENPPIFRHGNCNPSIAPNGDLYVADMNEDFPRIFRIFRTDWPKEQPVNGYAEKFIPKEKMATLMIEYARDYINRYAESSRLFEQLGNP